MRAVGNTKSLVAMTLLEVFFFVTIYDVYNIYNIQPLFTLGSVYSTSASGAEQTIETNNSNIT